VDLFVVAENQLIRISRDVHNGEIAIVSLYYPELSHVFTQAMRRVLLKSLVELMQDTTCRSVVLTGSGGDFCSGEDVEEMQSGSALDIRSQSECDWQIFEILAAGPKPVIAAVEGVAAGIGLALVCACDYVVSARDATFCAASIKLDLLPSAGLYWSLTQRIGGKARELMLTAREVRGEEIAQLGLADLLVETGETIDSACAMARRYTAMPPLTLALLRAALGNGSDSLDSVLETERSLQPLLRSSLDHQEAVAAFKEKRTPRFVGN
jgi:enoyl-CoA hydratase/carnithine racemase